MKLHPLEDVEAWFDDMACDDDSTPLGRVMEPLLLITSYPSLRMLHMHGTSHLRMM
jgi:hypothetical protein